MSPASRHKQKPCVVIPAYREQRTIHNVVERVRKYVQPVIVVDDGSPDRTAAEAADAGAVVVRHTLNMGKGVALNTGFNYARQNRFDYLITLDADGQHDPANIPRFIEAYERTGIPVLIGNRMGALSNMPQVRKWTNRYMSWLLSRAMNQYVPDTQCGFRLYRCDVLPFIEAQSARFAAESEILLHIASRGIRMDAVPIAVIYNEEISKISPIHDTFRFFLMLSRYYRSRNRSRQR